jgi:hydrogenase/urease accessory protein HupE
VEPGLVRALTLIEFALALVWAGFATGASAHSGGVTGYADLEVDGERVHYRLILSALPEALSALVVRGANGPDTGKLLETLASKVQVSNGSERCDPIGAQDKPASPGTLSTVLQVEYRCRHPVQELVVRDDFFDVAGADLHTLAKIEWPKGMQSFAFSSDSRELRVVITGAQEATLGVGGFFLLGIEHILTGYDHLLFLLALVLRGGNVLSLLKIVTAFTIAHSITLALAALNIVTLPDRLVESVIALSIAYVAAENLFLRKAVSHRWAVSFLFGLVHGFGFSAVLREMGLPRQGLMLSLLNFNLGVEAGQATAIAAILPLLLWVRRQPWEPRAIATASVVVLAVGLVLFGQRLIA